MVNRCEVFDEADLDAALARFDELSRPTPRLENTASQVPTRASLRTSPRATGTPMAAILADDFYSDDRRRVTGAGIRRGRDAEIENMRAVAELGDEHHVEVIATRGDRLVLTRTHFSSVTSSKAFLAEVLGLVETDPTSVSRRPSCSTSRTSKPPSPNSTPGTSPAKRPPTRTHGRSSQRPTPRYNRRELPPTTPDWVNVDRRRMTMYAPGDVFTYVRGGWDLRSRTSASASRPCIG